MYTKLVILAVLTLLGACLFVATGCDKLTTQVNNNTYYDSTLAEACLKCHSDNNNQIVTPKAQWVNSAHASGDLIEASVTWDSVSYLTSSCGPQCHTSQGFIKFTTDKTKSQQSSPSAIDCFTCHMPHTGAYGTWTMDTLRGYFKPLVLNDSSDYDMGKSQQCAICHQVSSYATMNVDGGSVSLDTLGANNTHTGADAQILAGVSGFLFKASKDSASHRSTAANGGCLACHFGPVNGNSSGQGYQFGEHTFRLQSDIGTQYTANCNGSVGNSGCHSAAPITNFYTDSLIDSIKVIGPDLGARLIAAGFIKPTDDSTHYYRDSIVPVDAARILYNYLLYKHDHSGGVHNPRYVLQLLRAARTRLDSLPRASFAADADTGCSPVIVNFTSTVSGLVSSYRWDFGDGTTSTDPNPQHPFVYKDSGKFRVTLTVSGGAGAKSTVAPNLIVVRDTLLKASFSHSGNGNGSADSLKVSFTSTSLGNILSFAWDFGDGAGTSSAEDTTYTYSAAGNYWVKLTITDLCKVITDSVQVTVPAPAGLTNVKRRLPTNN